jgi:hypothetical protein
LFQDPGGVSPKPLIASVKFSLVMEGIAANSWFGGLFTGLSAVRS